MLTTLQFEHLLEAKKEAKGITLDTELGIEELSALVREFKQTIQRAAGRDFPEDPRQQLNMARDAVFESSGNERANIYRRLNNISEELGRTAVNVQAMVFGNMGGELRDWSRVHPEPRQPDKISFTANF